MADSIELKDFRTLKMEEEKKLIQESINKIMNTLSFRKLAGKTQVILSLSGPNVRTRLTHTIEVAKIARDICKKLKLNEILGEAIALAHDIGHTPFGHVGERTLREIMCDCDTLKDQVSDCNFNNSGFKHNLQSFRVLNNFEQLAESKGEEKLEQIWPYIFWGAAAHSEMSWAKPQFGMDNEIFITCEHCNWVFVCHFHEKKECKKNVQGKKDLEKTTQNEICKPWYCAKLPTVDTKEKARELIKKGEITLKADDSLEDYVKEDFIYPDCLDDIYCRQKCYMAKLWKYKIHNKNSYLKHKFLYDHPFPNSFYAEDFYKFFYADNEENYDFISVEAVIVELADEIAQRQQDLEDGIQKNLISMGIAKEQVRDLVRPFFAGPDEINKKVKEIYKTNNQEELGSFLVKFYRDILTKSTRLNFLDFSNNFKSSGINIYCLINNVFELDEYKKYISSWLDNELSNLLSDNKFHINKSLLEPYFTIDVNEKYFCFIVFYYLEDLLKIDKLEDYNIFNKFIEYLKKHYPEESKDKLKDIDSVTDKVSCIKCINCIEPILRKESFKEVYDDVHSEPTKKEYWKRITDLNLFQFYFIEKLIQANNSTINTDTVTVKSIVDNINVPKSSTDEYHNEFDSVYQKWKQALGNSANQVLSNLVGFVSDEDSDKDTKEKELKKFKSNQQNMILHSEAVEKNDGKAGYILKRLFKAFVGNSHQLPDECLRMIIFNLIDYYGNYENDEEKCFRNIINKLKKTAPKTSNDDLIKSVLSLNFSLIANEDKDETKKYEDLFHKLSNEIKALLEKRLYLYKFLIRIKDNDVLYSLKKAMINDKVLLQETLRSLRSVLDNPVLNATPFWKSLLSRGICDYIASLTDQEAIDEYEKLYAGVMEIV